MEDDTGQLTEVSYQKRVLGDDNNVSFKALRK